MSDFAQNLSSRALVRAKALFLIAAFVSFVLSVSLWFTGSKEQGLFVGIWVPSILSLGALMLHSPRELR